ncbi:MAG: transposase [Desulfovibrio sp.]|nr:transposase [Desulfovibrio sp.]
MSAKCGHAPLKVFSYRRHATSRALFSQTISPHGPISALSSGRSLKSQSTKDICAYVGLAPITSHSGSDKKKAWIRPVGRRYLRNILVESAWRLITVETGYRDFYNRIRNETGLSQKAITATARKLLILIWHIAIEGRPYRPVFVN